MVVLIWKCRVRLLDDPQSLKEKRGVVRPLLERMRNGHGLSASEVGEHDRLNLAQLGFCTVGTDSRQLESIADRARTAMEATFQVEIVEDEMFLENY